MANILSPGVEAPDFTLHLTSDRTISLNKLKGKPVILAFYPADWSPACSNEVVLLNEFLKEFKKYNAELLGISVDGHWSHTAFAKHCNLHFFLLSDFEPKGEVARKYGAYSEKLGVCERALFVVDKEGKIAWSSLCPMGEVPSTDGILQALENLATIRT